MMVSQLTPDPKLLLTAALVTTALLPSTCFGFTDAAGCVVIQFSSICMS